MKSIGEWHVEIWVDDFLDDGTATKLASDIQRSLRSWASRLPRTVPHGRHISHTRITS